MIQGRTQWRAIVKLTVEALAEAISSLDLKEKRPDRAEILGLPQLFSEIYKFRE